MKFQSLITCAALWVGTLPVFAQDGVPGTVSRPEETAQKPLQRVNFKLDVIPPAGSTYAVNTATEKVVDAWLSVGFKSEGSGWFWPFDKLSRFDDWYNVISPLWPWSGNVHSAQAGSSYTPFLYASARYHVQAKDEAGQDVYTPSQYSWTAVGEDPKPEPYLYDDRDPYEVSDLAERNELIEEIRLRRPAGSTQDKFFHFDFGPLDAEDQARIRKTEVTAKVNRLNLLGFPDTSKPEIGPAKVTIRWRVPWEVSFDEDPTSLNLSSAMPVLMGDGVTYKPAGELQEGDKFYINGRLLRYTIGHITENPNGTRTFTIFVDPDDNIFDENGQLQQQIERLQEATNEAIVTGARSIKVALEAYKAVAEFYALGPLDVIATVTVAQAAYKSGELLKIAATAENLALRLRKVEQTTEAALARLRQLAGMPSQSPQQVASLREKIHQLEEAASKGRHLAGELDRLSAGCKRMGSEVKDAAHASGVGDGPFCFGAGTPVLMGDGSFRSIEAIRVGDSVMAKDVETGNIKSQLVTHTFKRFVNTTLVLNIGREKIVTTDAHPFYVENRGWVNAGELGIGTAIVTRAGPSAVVVSAKVNALSANVPVFNLTVANFHTYYVGESCALVHNQTGQTCAIEFENVVPDALAKFGSSGHKSNAWNNYTGTWDKTRWSNNYDNLSRIARQHEVDAAAVGAQLLPGGGGPYHVSPADFTLNSTRYLDWAHEYLDNGVKKLRGLEFKGYTSGPVNLSQDIRQQVLNDGKLIQQGADIRWVFKHNGPNRPLRDALRAEGIPWKMDTDVAWVSHGQTMPQW